MDLGVVIGAVGVIVSGVSIGIAIRANHLAERSTNAAEVSAQAAAGAAAEAKKANRIAEEANEKAADANRIAEENAAIARDRSQVQWVFQINNDGLITGVRNDSADPAKNVSVIVDAQGEREADIAAEHVPGLGIVPLELTGMWEKQFNQLRGTKPRASASIDGVAYGVHQSMTFNVRAWINWESAAGAPYSCVLDQKMTHRLERGLITTNRPRRRPEPEIF